MTAVLKTPPAYTGPFHLGDRVVLPPYGLGVICGTCTRQVGEQPSDYYTIEFPVGTSRAYVPTNPEATTGMRAALRSTEMPALLEHLEKGRLELPRQWSARHRRVTEILAAGNPFELASLTCELRRWNIKRGLPDLDRQAFRRAIRLLEQEVRGLEDAAAALIQSLLTRAWGEGPA